MMNLTLIDAATRSRHLRIVSALLLLVALSALPAQAAYIDNGDGTISDTVTGLMWDKCPYGQTANDCSGGSALRFTWTQALSLAVALNGLNSGAGYKSHNDWRLPSIKELESLVKIDTAPVTIDSTAFPNTDVTQRYWSSTLFPPPLPPFAGQVWGINFLGGAVANLDTSRQVDNSFVRVVHGGSSPGGFDLLAPSATAPVLLGAVSRRTHGAAGTFDLPLTLVALPSVNHNPTTEPRLGPTQSIVFTFDKPLNGATATVTEGTATPSSSVVGNTVVVSLAGVNDIQYVSVSLTGVASADGGTGGTGVARVGFLMGDVNQNRVVTVSDVGLVNAEVAQPVTSANFLKDINANGVMTVSDKGLANSAVVHALPAP